MNKKKSNSKRFKSHWLFILTTLILSVTLILALNPNLIITSPPAIIDYGYDEMSLDLNWTTTANGTCWYEYYSSYPELYYKMGTLDEEISGTYDLVNNIGTASFYIGAGCKIGSCVELNDTENLNITINDAMNFTTGNKSLNYWVKPNIIGQNDIMFDQKKTDGSERFQIGTSGVGDGSGINLNKMVAGGTSFDNSSTFFAVGVWTMVTLSFNDTHYTLYINGSMINNSDTQFKFGGNSIANFIIGSTYSSSDGLFGNYDEISVWNRSLSPSEVSELWNSGNGLNATDLTAGNTLTNIIIDCATNYTSFTFTNNQKNLTFYAQDDGGLLNQTFISWDYNLYENLINYSTTVLATNNETFAINLTYNSSKWISSSAKLNYNGTTYTSSRTTIGNNLIFSNTIIVPSPTSATNYNFFWNVSLTNSSGTYYITSQTSSQQVTPLSSINVTSLTCPSGFSSAFNFTSLIENNLTAINFTSISYNLQYGSSGNSSALTSNGSFSNIPNFNICINSSYSYYLGYGEIQYEVDGFSNRRFYIFENTRLTNTTIANNLYSLTDGDSTAFQVTATDTTLTPYVNYYITLLRWYPDLNTYKVVDMGKTDSQGQTILNVKTNDVDYRLGLYTPAGVLVKLLDPIRMICQTTPCIYSLIVSLDETDLTTFLNIQSNLSYDPVSKIFTYTFNDPSQDTTLMNLTIWQDFGDRDSVIICSTTSSDFTGVLVCDVSAYTGQLRAEVWRSASPKILIAQLTKSIRTTLVDVENGKAIGLFIGLIMVVLMALIGVVSPILMVILTMVSLIPLIFFGIIDKAVFLIIGAMAGIILHFLRRIT